MRGRLFLEGGMIMMSRVMSYGENANGHTYTKKSHDVTKDQPRTVRPVPVDALCTNSYLLFV